MWHVASPAWQNDWTGPTRPRAPDSYFQGSRDREYVAPPRRQTDGTLPEKRLAIAATQSGGPARHLPTPHLGRGARGGRHLNDRWQLGASRRVDASPGDGWALRPGRGTAPRAR